LTGSPIALLAPGATDEASYSGSYTLQQSDVDAGGVSNTASATGNDPSGAAVSDTSDAGTDGDNNAIENPEGIETPLMDGTLPGDGTANDPTISLITPAPELRVVKSVSEVTDTNGNGVTDAGDVIHYSFTVTNIGNVTLTDVSVSDPLLSGAHGSLVGSPIASLAPEASDTSYSGSYTLQQSDIDAGGVSNTATASGTPPNKPDGSSATPITATSDTGTDGDNNAIENPEDVESPLLDGTLADDGTTNDPTVSLITPAPKLSVIKSVSEVVDTNENGFTDAGDVIHYSFTITNTGNVTLTDVSLSDPLLEGDYGSLVGSPIASLAPGVSDTSYTGSYNLQQSDINEGGVSNSATVSGRPPNKPDGSVATPITDVSDAGTD
ncbi:hypothetical protein, partial [Tenacibaculum sp. UWU-22]|uniref:DUF7507 domain-containing protein n=1 Tax=Tenacibaculum sp. UWU-22 TaxID=3234187 RepID=UPI0034DAE349